jgi:hypothetical protein
MTTSPLHGAHNRAPDHAGGTRDEDSSITHITTIADSMSVQSVWWSQRDRPNKDAHKVDRQSGGHGCPGWLWCRAARRVSERRTDDRADLAWMGAADDYQHHFEAEVSDHLQAVSGFCGARLLRREDGQEVMFTSITYFTGLDAVRAFAGASSRSSHIGGTARPAQVEADHVS